MTTTTLTPVESSQIAAVGFDASTNKLTIEFKRGNTRYEYSNVTAEMYQQMMDAPSIGSWFSAVVKKNTSAYPFKQIA